MPKATTTRSDRTASDRSVSLGGQWGLEARAHDAQAIADTGADLRYHCLSTVQGPDGRGGQDCPCPRRAWAYRVRMPVVQLRHQCTDVAPVSRR
jgi:hypothetical protein